MKCLVCKAEWQLPSTTNNILEKCPFCGAPLKVRTPKSLDTIEDVLVEIVNRFGLEALYNGSRLVAVFSDLAPKLRKEKLLLTYLIQSDSHLKLLELKNIPPQSQNAHYKKVLQYLVDEQFIVLSAAEMICQSFLCAIGISVPTPKPGVHTSPINHPTIISNTSCSVPVINDTIKLVTASSKEKLHSVENYQHYLFLLEQSYKANRNAILTPLQLRSFIAKYRLDVDCNITVDNVQADLNTIIEKYRLYVALHNVLQIKLHQEQEKLYRVFSRLFNR